MKVKLTKADSRMAYAAPLNPKTGPAHDKNLDFQICCVCGILHVEGATEIDVLKPHLHFHTDKTPMHQFYDVKLNRLMEEKLLLSSVRVRMEATVCLEHLTDDPLELWQLLEDWYDITSPHSTNALNIGAKVHSNVFNFDDLVENTNKLVCLSLRARWRSTFTERFEKRSKKYLRPYLRSPLHPDYGHVHEA
jgi:hypothetical protein